MGDVLDLILFDVEGEYNDVEDEGIDKYLSNLRHLTYIGPPISPGASRVINTTSINSPSKAG